MGQEPGGMQRESRRCSSQAHVKVAALLHFAKMWGKKRGRVREKELERRGEKRMLLLKSLS